VYRGLPKKLAGANRPLRSAQPRPRRLRLLGGLVLWVTALYHAPRPNKGRAHPGGGLYPELAALGFHQGQSAALVSRVARAVALLPSFAVAHRELARDGLGLDGKTVHGITHRLGRDFLAARRLELQRYRSGQMPAGTRMAGKRVVAQLDGGRIRLREVRRKQKGKGKSKSRRRRYKGEWREPKLLTVFEIDAHGKKVQTARVLLDGTFQGPDEVMELLAMHLHRLGAAQAEVVVFVADGAPWIWERLPWVVRRVGLEVRRVEYALDWCHAIHHVGLALAKAPLGAAEHRRVFKKLRKWLKAGQAEAVLKELKGLGKRHGVLPALKTELAYLRKHLKAGRLSYGRMVRKGLPIGSGGIESAIRRVVNLRLKGNGQMWLEGNAEGMILLRAAALTGRWGEGLAQALRAKCEQGHGEWRWASPDMPLQLKANITIRPPTHEPKAA
jgi:hypothetical protein